MLKRAIGIISRLFSGMPLFFADVSEFNAKVAFWRYIAFCFPSKKGEGYINALSEYMADELSEITVKYNTAANAEKDEPLYDMNGKTPVFICWWQGEDSMPPLVKACFERIKSKLKSDLSLHLITEKNYNNYISLPQVIQKKYEEKKITLIHLTDIIRYQLAKRYGGVWIDSTVYLSDDFIFDKYDRKYYSQAFSSPVLCPNEPCMGKWCNFFFCGSADNVLFSYVYDSLIYWWEKHDKLIDYIIVDYVIRSGYFGVDTIRALIDSVDANNEDMWIMGKILNKPFDSEEYSELMKQNGFYKLSYKGNYTELLPNGDKTIYGHLVGKE